MGWCLERNSRHTSSGFSASIADPPSRTRVIPRLLQIEAFAVSSVTKQGGLAHLRSMSIRQKTTIRRILPTQCIPCGASPPAPATTGRPRVYCGPGCRKAAYDDRRARKPEAFQVRVAERIAVETVETISTVDEGQRKQLFIEVQKIFAENLPALYFAAPRVFVATSSRLINLQPSLIRPQLTWTADTIAVRDATTNTQ